MSVSPDARRFWERYRPPYSVLEVQHLLDYFHRLADEMGADPQAFDFEQDLMDWSLTYDEARRGIQEKMRFQTEQGQMDAMIGELLREAESLLADTEFEIVESKDLRRLERAAARLDRVKEMEARLKRQVDEFEARQARFEAARRAVPTAPLPPPMGLTTANEAELERYWKRLWADASKPMGWRPYHEAYLSLMDELRSDLAHEDRTRAVELSKGEIRTLVNRFVAVAPSPDTRLRRVEAAVKRLESQLVRGRPSLFPPRNPQLVVTMDVWTGEPVTIDEDEVVRLKYLLYDKSRLVLPEYLRLSPDGQRLAFGMDTRGMLRVALWKEFITRNDIVAVGLRPEDYGL